MASQHRKGTSPATAQDVMTAAVRTCSPDTNLASAAALMLDGDCGMLPVVEDGRLIGVVTDRDLYIALATRNVRASDLRVADVVQTPAHSCGPDDDLDTILATMRRYRVRRLPVEGFGGTVMGIVSMNDLILAGSNDEEVTDTLRSICAHHHPVAHIAAA